MILKLWGEEDGERREPDKKKYKKSDLVTTKPQQQSIQIHMTYINPKRPIVSSMEVELTRKHIIHCKTNS